MSPDEAARRGCRCRLCVPDPIVAHDDAERNALRIVQEHGWLVTNIAPSDGLLGWAFTTGLTHSFGWPELAMAGLPSADLHACLNTVGERARAGERFADGAVVADVLEDYDVVVRRADPAWNSSMFGWSQWFAQHDEPVFGQVVWPDRNGRFPWEDDADPTIESLQPDLAIPPYEHAHGSWRAWAFDCAWPGRQHSRGLVFVSRSIVEDAAPVLVVGLDGDGDSWSFTDGTDTDDASKVALAHVFHLLMQDPELEQFGALRPGQTAWRERASAPWHIEDD